MIPPKVIAGVGLHGMKYQIAINGRLYQFVYKDGEGFVRLPEQLSLPLEDPKDDV